MSIVLTIGGVPLEASTVIGATTWCDRCDRTTLICRNADDCHAPRPLPSSGVAGADRFFADAEPLFVDVPTPTHRVRARVRSVS